jgi:leucyl aminopeptidase
MGAKNFNYFPEISHSIVRSEKVFKDISAVAIPVLQEEKLSVKKTDLAKLLTAHTHIDLSLELANWPEFTAKAGEIIEIPLKIDDLNRIYLVGIGTATDEDIRKASSVLGRKVKASDATVLTAIVEDKKQIEISVMALALANYQFTFKSEKKSKKPQFVIYGDFKDQIERANIFAKATWQARDLIHTPSNIKNPQWLANQAKSFVTASKSSALSIKVKAGRELKDFGGLLAVGNSSPKPGPRFVELTYAPKGSANWPHVVLVGKGITFDTGGVSLKRPYDMMVGMKSDMAGAAAILSATVALAELKPKVKVTALLMCAENALSGTSQRPSDVIKHFGGTTVEVINTDAEGRLVLADGLAYADLKLDPDYLVDVATLTGAATLGLGRQYAAMYTRDNSLAKKLHLVGNTVGEKVWQMPLVDEYEVALESDVADFNHTADKYDFSAGSVTAALFLEKFVGDRKWVHFDIAGPGRSEVDAGENIKGGTGFATRLLLGWLDTF